LINETFTYEKWNFREGRIKMMIEKCKKKKKKGQLGFGAILVAFIGIVVGIALFMVIAQTIGTSTNTVAVVNKSLGVASNSTTVYLTDYVSLSDIVIYNGTGSAVIPSTNYTVTTHVVYNGAEVVSILPKATAAYRGYEWNVSGTAEPQGYIGGAGRSMALLIPIFFALLIAVIALEPTLRGGLKDLMGV
jgi:hypothetical protein